RARRLALALGGLAVGALLTAFWTLPLVARLAETRALAWGRLVDAIGFPLLPMLLALLAARAMLPAWASRSGAAWMTALFPWAAGAAVLADAFVLEPAGLRWLPADRVMDSAWLALVLAGALGAGGIQGVDTRGPWPAHYHDVQRALTAVLAFVV